MNRTISGFGAAGWAFVFIILICAGSTHAQVSNEIIEAQIQYISTEASISLDKKEQYNKKLEALKNQLSALESINNSEAEFKKITDTFKAGIKEQKADYEVLLQSPQNNLAPSVDTTSISSIENNLTRLYVSRGVLEGELELHQKQVNQELGKPDQLKSQLQELAIRNVENVTIVQTQPLDIGAKLSGWQRSINEEIALAKIKSAEAELISSPIKLEWLQSKLLIKELSFDRINSNIKFLEELLANLRAKEAENIRDKSIKVEATLADQHPLVKGAAAENTELSNLHHDMTEKLSRVKELVSNLNIANQEMSEDFSSTQHKIEVAGLSHALGQVLLEEKRRLAELDFFQWEQLVEEDEVAEIGISQIQHEEYSRKIRDNETYIDDLVLAIKVDEVESVRADLTTLVKSRLELLTKLVSLEKNYLRALGDLDYITRQFKQQVVSYENLINEKLLWIKSSPALNYKLLDATINQVNDFWSKSNVIRLVQDLKKACLSNLSWLILTVFVLVFFIIKRGFLIGLVESSAAPLKRLTSDSFQYTLKALFYSIILASPVGLMLIIAGHSLLNDGMGALASAAGQALIITGGTVYFVLIVMELCRDKGILLAHFKWSEIKVAKTYSLMKKLCCLFCPALFVSALFINYDFGPNHGALQHLAFISSMLILSVCIITTGILKRPFNAQKIVSFGFLLAPMILAGFAALGYVYTASTLCHRLIDTFSYFVSLLLVHQLTMRSLVLAHRKLAYKTALEKRAALKLKTQEDTMGEIIEEPAIDLDAVSKGGKELLNTALVIGGAIGLWLIWAEVLPAFYAFDQSPLWYHTEMKNGLDVKVPVTLLDLGLALFISGLTILAAKRLPTLIEFLLLPYFRLSAGSLYTVRTLTGYLIVAVGIITTLNTIGASWSQLQWMAAALSVGIGFGLQEIVANFISGLIILFERPIRVGDVVTVGGTDGVVTRIQIRATTIRNWDSKELLVPNKEFITNQLLNWTLSDQTTRLVTTVGVAYGTDITKAMNIVLNTAKAHPNVIPDPEPNVVFQSMGDSALNLILRSYVAKTDHRAVTASELNVSVYEALNDAGIGIPFPQRDVHLNTSSPLEVSIRSRNH